VNRSTTLWIVAFALAARLSAAAVVSPSAESLLASAHHEHASIAKNLAEGRGFRFNFFGDIHHPDLTSQQAPFVPSLIAGAYLLFGVESTAALWFVAALQIFAGALTCIALGDAVFHWTTNRRAAVLTAVMASAYPPLIASTLHLQALPWNLFWIALILCGSARIHTRSPHGIGIMAIGGAGGLLTDPILVVVLATLAVGLILRHGIYGFKTSTAVALIVAVAIAPWIVRNYQVHGRFEFVKNSMPYVFWQGNTLLSAGTDKLLVDESQSMEVAAASIRNSMAASESARRRSRSINDVALSENDLRELSALPNEAARMDWFGRRIRAELAADPLHYFKMCGARLVHWAWFDATNPKSNVLGYRISYLTLAAWALLGLAFAARWMTPLLAVATVLSLFHILVITSARFRVCLELLMIPLAAHGVLASIAAVSRTAALDFKSRIFASRPFSG
jgi:hypothetical protein